MAAPQENVHGRNVRINMLVSTAQMRWQKRLLARYGTRCAVHAKVVRAHRIEAIHGAIAAVAMLAVVFDVGLAPLNISWANLPRRAPAAEWQAHVLFWGNAVAIGFFVCHRAYVFCHPSRFRRSVILATLDVLACVLQPLALGAFAAANAWQLAPSITAGVALSGGMQLALVAAGLWRVVRTIQAASATSVGASASEARERSRPLSVETFSLVWVSRSADLLFGYLPELHALLEALRETLELPAAESGVGELLRLRIFCTEPDHAKREELRAYAAGFGLDGELRFERPDLQGLVSKEMVAELHHSTSAADRHRMLLTFCGAPAAANACLDGCARANGLAARLGRAVRIDFREEFYGHAGGRRARIRSESRVSTFKNHNKSAIKPPKQVHV